MFAINTTLISIVFILLGLAYLLALAFLVIVHRRDSASEGEATDHVFSIIVPAHNEAAVIGATLDSILAMDYPPEKCEVLVVDDGSDDETGAIVSRVAAMWQNRVQVLSVPKAMSARGKSSALNNGFAFLLENSKFRGSKDWIVGVFDADGRPSRNLMKKASFQFRKRSVGGVQASVRIANRKASLLTRMQDVEFAGFTRVTQMMRMRLAGSVSLGGNGQFVRVSALEDVAIDGAHGLYWNPRSLTEDLDLTVRLSLRNWDMRHLDTACVDQEGVEHLKPLLRQRTRWAWGSLQVFSEYVVHLKILRAPGVQLRKRLDMLLVLSLFLVSPMVMVTWILSGLALVGVIRVVTTLPQPALFLLSFAYLPFVAYGMLTIRRYERIRLPFDLVVFAVYTYHWVPCMCAGIWRLVTRRDPVWWKTKRAVEPVAG